MSKKLTIVFPAYNDHSQLKRALCSLRDQTFRDFEVIVLDDVASRPYEETIATFQSFFDTRVIRNERNLGAMDNMWQSIQFPITTPYIMSHHTDDFLKSDYLERAIAILESKPNVSFVLTGPEWVSLNTPYRQERTYANGSTSFDAADFAHNVMHFAPYMFGSVVYRASHRVADWGFPRFNILCDRYFLGSILDTNDSCGVFLEGNGIFERDHSKDKTDARVSQLNESHVIQLILFYQELLRRKYPETAISVLVTNYILYALAGLPGKKSFRESYSKLSEGGLIRLFSVRPLGLYSLAKILVSKCHSYLYNDQKV